MRMAVIFSVFAGLAFLVSICFSHIAGGIGRDMTAAYLVLAVLSAMIGLLRSGAAK